MIRAVVLDVEGTTSSIGYVHEQLFPYASRVLGSWVAAHGDEPKVADALRSAARTADRPDADRDEIVDILRDWIRRDAKVAPLKTIQGLIWQDALAAGALTVLLIHEPRRADPLIELRFFRSLPFAGATVIAISAFGAFSGFLFMNTLYLQAIRGLSPMHAGLCTVPLGLTVLICSPISGRVVGRHGPRPPLLLAATMICLGAGMLLFVTPGTALAYVLASYLAFGVGQGVVNAPITNTAVSGMPRSHAGVAAAVATTSRNIGTSLGVAIVGSILSSHVSGMFAADFMAAGRPALWVIVGLGFTVFVVGAATTTASAQRTAQRIAHLFPEGESAGALGGDLGDASGYQNRIEVPATGHQRR